MSTAIPISRYLVTPSEPIKAISGGEPAFTCTSSFCVVSSQLAVVTSISTSGCSSLNAFTYSVILSWYVADTGGRSAVTTSFPFLSAPFPSSDSFPFPPPHPVRADIPIAAVSNSAIIFFAFIITLLIFLLLVFFAKQQFSLFRLLFPGILSYTFPIPIILTVEIMFKTIFSAVPAFNLVEPVKISGPVINSIAQSASCDTFASGLHAIETLLLPTSLAYLNAPIT